MEVTPLAHYPEPAYPSSRILAQHPELLRLVPNRWRSNAVVLGALAGVCIVLAGCRALGAEPQGQGAHTRPAASKVAPLFIHGDGRGSYGCVVINPPVFLSEDEARQVIRDEARRSGIHLDETQRALPSVAVPRTRIYTWDDKPLSPATKVERMPLDGADKARNIGFVFVSERDYDAWHGQEGVISTVSSYDIKGAAKRLQAGIAAARPSGAYGVFYDPVALMRLDLRPPAQPGTKATDAPARSPRDTAKEQLRAQVKDFIAWLKAQGVI